MMKHIFFVHSHICYAMSRAIIKFKNLSPDEVIFIVDRNYTLLDKTSASLANPPEDWFAMEKNIVKGWQKHLRIEKYIQWLCSTEFEYYCPHTLLNFSNFLADHPNCKATHLIEEGTASYLSTEHINTIHPPVELDWKNQIFSKLFYAGRYRTRIFYRKDISKAYCTDANAFPDQPNKVVLPLDLQESLGQWQTNELKIVLALDSAVETKYASPQSYMTGIQRLIEHLQSSKTADTLQVKLHPYQYVNRSFADLVLARLQSALEPMRVIELPPDAAIETMTPIPGARLYLGISSLSIYAKRNGLPCYSFADTIAQTDRSYGARLEQQPRAFFESVRFI